MAYIFRIYDYPKNLLATLYGFSITQEEIENNEQVLNLNADQLKGLEYAISTLPEKGQLVIKERYINKSTLEAIGEKLGVTAPRVRMILWNNLQKLRNYRLKRYYEQGYEQSARIIELEKKEKLEQEKIIQEFYNNNPKEIPIEAANLSVRAYNCLCRNDIEKLGEIKSKEQLINMRNIGSVTLENIENVLASYGIRLPESEET